MNTSTYAVLSGILLHWILHSNLFMAFGKRKTFYRPNFDQTIVKPVKTTVGCIIEDKGKILITKRNIGPFKGYWCVPGGHIDFGESPIEAVKREIKEEVGLDIKPRFFDYFNEYFPEYDWHAVVIMFIAKSKGDVRIQKTEVKEYKWISKDDIDSYKWAFVNKDIIRSFFSYDKIMLDKKRICEIVNLSKKIGNEPEDIIRMMQHHTDEIQELFDKKKKHFSIETGDLVVLAIELLIMEGYSVDDIMHKCYERFEKKLKDKSKNDINLLKS